LVENVMETTVVRVPGVNLDKAWAITSGGEWAIVLVIVWSVAELAKTWQLSAYSLVRARMAKSARVSAKRLALTLGWRLEAALDTW
jgi:hypothetical protein